MTRTNGQILDGNWNNGGFVGGIVQLPYENGDFYKGEYQNNNFHGKGTLMLAGARYTGLSLIHI